MKNQYEFVVISVCSSIQLTVTNRITISSLFGLLSRIYILSLFHVTVFTWFQFKVLLSVDIL